jgi:uncharacterized membrane protein (DUF4010 family)
MADWPVLDANLGAVDGKTIIGLATALGIGLLMGAERERSQTGGPNGAIAGVRTFALTALLGATAALFESPALLVAFALLVGFHSALAYFRAAPEDPGLTSEIALLLAYLLGIYALRNPEPAAALGVIVTILLAARSWLHRFVKQRLSEQELYDALLLGACALVVLPLLPDRAIDPWQVLNPRTIWKFAVVLMTINGLGYLALRALGAERGLPLAGLAAGFVSSSATHGAMGSRARSDAALLRPAVAAAAWSSVATSIQLALIIGVIDLSLLRSLAAALLASGLTAGVYGAVFLWHALQRPLHHEMEQGRAFNPRFAVGFALLMATVVVLAAMAQRYVGSAAAFASIALSGLVDTHSAAASAASLHHGQMLDLQQARVAVLAAYSTNALTKAVASCWYGGASFGRRLVPGIVLMVAAAWAGFLLD